MKVKTAGDIRVAVVHDWLTGMRGGEVVLESILDLFPDADLFTLLHNKGSISDKISGRRVFTSFIDRLPFKTSRYRQYLPFFPTAIEQFDFHGYDLILSSSHCVARGVLPPPGTVHISYLHSPMRYVWDMYHEYFPARGFMNRFVVPFFAHYLRMWDYNARDRVDAYICNSSFVAQRIKRFYGKDSRVVAPPCLWDSKAIQVNEKRADFYLVVSALVPYKRIDLTIEAMRQRPEDRLIIVGTGPEEKTLRANLPPNVEFRGRVDRAQILDLYSRARALLFPGIEDFGIVPVEAQARGCPVIAYNKGGALETVVDGRTGVLFDEQTVAGLIAGIQTLESLQFKKADFEKNARRFTDSQFKQGIMKIVHQYFPVQKSKKKPGARSRGHT